MNNLARPISGTPWPIAMEAQRILTTDAENRRRGKQTRYLGSFHLRSERRGGRKASLARRFEQTPSCAPSKCCSRDAVVCVCLSCWLPRSFIRAWSLFTFLSCLLKSAKGKGWWNSFHTGNTCWCVKLSFFLLFLTISFTNPLSEAYPVFSN